MLPKRCKGGAAQCPGVRTAQARSVRYELLAEGLFRKHPGRTAFPSTHVFPVLCPPGSGLRCCFFSRVQSSVGLSSPAPRPIFQALPPGHHWRHWPFLNTPPRLPLPRGGWITRGLFQLRLPLWLGLAPTSTFACAPTADAHIAYPGQARLSSIFQGHPPQTYPPPLFRLSEKLLCNKMLKFAEIPAEAIFLRRRATPPRAGPNSSSPIARRMKQSLLAWQRDITSLCSRTPLTLRFGFGNICRPLCCRRLSRRYAEWSPLAALKGSGCFPRSGVKSQKEKCRHNRLSPKEIERQQHTVCNRTQHREEGGK